MGVFKMFSSSSYDNKPTVVYETKYLPNPNPNNFTIEDSLQIKNNVIVLINYHDATNYEGKKILVFQNYTINQLEKRKSIDPHFSESKQFKSPFARFEPTEQGWNAAIKLCKLI